MVRFKNRYVLAHIKSDKKTKISQSELMDNLKKSIQKFYGDFGAASIANIGLRYYNEKHKLVIIRIPHGPHRFVTSVLPLLTKAGSELARYRIVYIGATIRQCKRHIVVHQNSFIRQTIGKLDCGRSEFLKSLENNLGV